MALLVILKFLEIIIGYRGYNYHRNLEKIAEEIRELRKDMKKK
jgi:hypothetical protein